jgi:hypothetical protein
MNTFCKIIVILLALGIGEKGMSEEPKNIKSTPEITLPGIYLDAWKVVYSDFRDMDLTKEERKLSNYEICFSEDGEHFIIYFAPEILSDEELKTLRGTKVTRGKEIRYLINKKNFKIDQREFFK